jgi:hypothetical protein
VECKNNFDRGNWNHFKIIQKIPEKHAFKKLEETVIVDTAHIFGK